MLPLRFARPYTSLSKHWFSGTVLANTPENSKLFDIARSVHWVPKDGVQDRTLKKRGMGEESDEEDATLISGPQVGPPPNDVYRKRQQKRVK